MINFDKTWNIIENNNFNTILCSFMSFIEDNEISEVMELKYLLAITKYLNMINNYPISEKCLSNSWNCIE